MFFARVVLPLSPPITFLCRLIVDIIELLFLKNDHLFISHFLMFGEYIDSVERSGILQFYSPACLIVFTESLTLEIELECINLKIDEFDD